MWLEGVIGYDNGTRGKMEYDGEILDLYNGPEDPDVEMDVQLRETSDKEMEATKCLVSGSAIKH